MNINTTSLWVNAYQIMHLPDNGKKVFMTNHQLAIDHRHIPTIIQDIIIIHKIIGETIPGHHHLSVIIINGLNNYDNRNNKK